MKSAHYADLTKDPAAGRTALVEALRRIDAAGGWGWPDGRSPFPGLRAFGVEDHRVFFGRGQEVNQLATLLRSPAERTEAVHPWCVRDRPRCRAVSGKDQPSA